MCVLGHSAKEGCSHCLKPFPGTVGVVWITLDSRDARVRGNAYISCFYCNAHAHASVELAHITDEVRLLLTATTAAYYIVYLPDFVH